MTGKVRHRLRMPWPPLIQRLARIVACACLVALAVLSLLPKDDMVRTGVDGRAEHFVAYAGTMTACGLAWGARFPVLRLAAVLIAYAAALELGQYLSPGRTPALADFAAGATGTVVAALAGATIVRR